MQQTAALLRWLRGIPAFEGRPLLNLGVRPLTPFAKDNRMKMYPDDWQVRLTTGVVSIVCTAAALMLAPGVVNRFWTLLLFLVVALIVGGVALVAAIGGGL